METGSPWSPGGKWSKILMFILLLIVVGGFTYATWWQGKGAYVGPKEVSAATPPSQFTINNSNVQINNYYKDVNQAGAQINASPNGDTSRAVIVQGPASSKGTEKKSGDGGTDKRKKAVNSPPLNKTDSSQIQKDQRFAAKIDSALGNIQSKVQQNTSAIDGLKNGFDSLKIRVGTIEGNVSRIQSDLQNNMRQRDSVIVPQDSAIVQPPPVRRGSPSGYQHTD